jgi:tetratricopeptide (TPR) repeat protein
MCRRIVLAVALLVLVGPVAVTGEGPVEAARALLVAWHEEPARIDRARALLETAVAANRTPTALIELSHVWFLTGDFRATTESERLAAYERGADTARRAVAAAPRDERAHLWLALNTGRMAELRGAMRAAGLLTTIRSESQTVLALNPSSVEGLILAGSLAAELPGILGGDRARAEALLTRALELDPHHTGGRLELARFYLASQRWHHAQRELQHVVEEPAATDLPRWTVSERPRATALLAELYARGRVPASSQSP